MYSVQYHGQKKDGANETEWRINLFVAIRNEK